RQRMEFVEDLFVIHDPQPAALIRSKERNRGKWIWRCHIDLSNPHREVWNFLKPFVEQYDATIFSSPAFTRQLSVPQYLFYPSIDPLSEKNKDLDETYVQKVCDDFGIDRSRPVITQISRFDRLKGPVGGIPTQVIHKLTGMLVHSVEGCAYQIRYLLTHPDFAAQLGRHGHEHSKENFLLTSNIKRWLILFQQMLGLNKPVKVTE